MRPEAWEQDEAWSRRRATKRSLLSLATSLVLLLSFGAMAVLSDFDLDPPEIVKIGLAVALLALALLTIGLSLWATGAISASRKLHRVHGVPPLPLGRAYLLPTIAMLIGAWWAALLCLMFICSVAPGGCSG